MYRLSVKQLEYYNAATHRWNVKTGATRSGKTYMDYFVIPRRIRACTGKGLIMLIGNTKTTLERNLLDPMRQLWTPSLVGTIQPATGAVQLFGRKCYALGADKITQVSKLQGSGIEYCYGDEITTWHEDVFTMLKSRLDKPNSCFDGTCNPDNPSHWFKVFLDGDADIYQQSYTIDDNPFLSPEFVANLKREYAGTVYYDRYIRGLWCAAEGVVYRAFADDPAQFIVDELPPLAFAVIGVDFGGNGSAHAFNCTGISKDFRQVVTCAEYYRKEIISPSELETDFCDFVRRCRGMGLKVYNAYCDSAEQTLIEGLRAATLREHLGIDVQNAIKGPINDRIRFYCRLMGQRRYKVARSCEHTIQAFRDALWDARSITKDVRLDNGTTNIDSLDAQEYSTEALQNDIIFMGAR